MAVSLKSYSEKSEMWNWTIISLFLFLFIGICQSQQMISPCPRLFTYEPKGAENDRWYGTVTLLYNSDLNGVWLRLVFDRPSLQLGNWFGEVKTDDNKEYLIKNRDHKLIADVPYKLRFYIKYDPAEPPPKLVGFRLNARVLCPEGVVTTTTETSLAQLITSVEFSTTPSPTSSSSNGGSFFRPPGNNFNRPQPADEDDFFHGDFASIFRPNKPINQLGSNQMDATCGTVVTQPKPLITYGQSTIEGEFPWHAALYHANGIDLTYFCGASLITKQHLITVAHCVTRRKSQLAIGTDAIVIYLGKYFLRRWSNAGIQNKHVDSITPHPDYNPQVYANDVAIIKMISPVEITNYVRPVCLWTGDSQLEPIVNTQGTVVGWGFDETGKVTEQLTKAKMPIVSQQTCIYSYPDFYSRFTSNTTFCAGFINGTSVCNGDSGGGMVFPKASSDPKKPIWQIRGLVSISVAALNQRKCDTSHYVVFTDVAKHLDWIRASLT